MNRSIFIAIVCFIDFLIFGQPNPYIEISSGTIKGSYLSSSSGRKFLAFRGIPYAKPPVGELRFQEPIQIDPWEGILDATNEGPSCVQYDFVTKGIKGKEDCLVLNVYTHSFTPDEGVRPVMVWIHGGGFFMGSGNGENDLFGPNHLMNNDIVLVTMNYRLGALGFYSTNTEKAPGNYGLLDQLLALKWVQNNIHHFGGNASSVTLFGESAGGASVHYHVLSPLSKGLFHRAIAQSGTSLCPWARSEAVAKHSFYLAKKLGCLQKKSDAQLDCVRNKKAEDLVLIPDEQFFPAMVFGPRIDVERKNPFLPDDPRNLLEKGQYNHVPLITGVTKNEGLAFMAASGLLSSKERMQDFETNWIRSLKYLLTIQDHKDAVGISKRAMNHYLSKDIPIAKQISELEKMVSDITFFKCIDDVVKLHNKHDNEPVYYYMYSHRGQHTVASFYGTSEVDYGVCHADELLVMFSNNILPPLSNGDDIKVSKLLVDLWTSFSSIGKPMTEEVTQWPPTTKKETLYLNISVHPHLVKEEMPFRHRLAFWDELMSASYDNHEL